MKHFLFIQVLFLVSEMMSTRVIYFNENNNNSFQKGSNENPFSYLNKLNDFLSDNLELVLQTNISCNSSFQIKNDLFFEYKKTNFYAIFLKYVYRGKNNFLLMDENCRFFNSNSSFFTLKSVRIIKNFNNSSVPTFFLATENSNLTIQVSFS